MRLSMISTSDPALWRPDTFLFGHGWDVDMGQEFFSMFF